MNLNKFAQRVALLDEVTYNINSGNELRDDQVSAVAGGEATDIPADFHKMSLSEKTEWVAGVMKEYIKGNIDALFKEEYALRGGVFFGKLILTIMKTEVVTIDPQDH